MIRIVKIALMLAIAVVCGLAAAPNAKADPLRFSNVAALQNNGNNTSRVDLFASPGATLTLTEPRISFLVDITGTLPPGVTQTLSITYAEAGSPSVTQTFDIPAFGTGQPPFTVLFTFPSVGASYQGMLASLRVDILGSAPDFEIPGGPQAGQLVDSYTYNFSVATPVPEPATMIMLATGFAGLWGNARRKLRRAQ